jgi:hypothetical protein
MKHSLFALLAVALAIGTAGCSRKSDEQIVADARTAIVKSCKVTGKQKAATLDDATIERFCTCSADKVIAALGVEAVRDLSSRNTLTDNDKAKLQEAAMACQAEVVKAQ